MTAYLKGNHLKLKSQQHTNNNNEEEPYGFAHFSTLPPTFIHIPTGNICVTTTKLKAMFSHNVVYTTKVSNSFQDAVKSRKEKKRKELGQHCYKWQHVFMLLNMYIPL